VNNEMISMIFVRRPKRAGRPVPERAGGVGAPPVHCAAASRHRAIQHTHNPLPCSAAAAGHGGVNCSFSMRSVYHEHDIWSEFVVGNVYGWFATQPDDLAPQPDALERTCAGAAWRAN
jgi:hypothetical protein